MTIVKTISECRSIREAMGKSLALVPTMGALHAGHLSLVSIAKRHAARVAVSIFVNPTQFSPKEDFSKYPRPIEDDLQMCREAGVDLVFMPDPVEMYPEDAPQIQIELPRLFDVLEGAHRPGHFAGVCQVVAKLFHIVQPTVACFGEKDYQQLAVLSAMTKALDFPIEIIGCPILRDRDHLAMSSRNRYLSQDERRRALSISEALYAISDLAAQGEDDADKLRTIMQRMLRKNDQPEIPTEIQYAEITDVVTLRRTLRIYSIAQALVAMKVGNTRLIDNMRLVVGTRF